MSRRSVRRASRQIEHRASDGRFAFELESIDPNSFPVPLDERLVIHTMANVRHGVLKRTGSPIVVSLREELSEKLELGTMALVGSTFYRLEEAVSDYVPGPPVTSWSSSPYNGWSLRPVDAPPKRGYFRKVLLRTEPRSP